MLIGTWVAPYSKFTPRSVKQFTTSLGKILYFYIDSIYFFDRDTFGRSGPRPLVEFGFVRADFEEFSALRCRENWASGYFSIFGPFPPLSLPPYFFTSLLPPDPLGQETTCPFPGLPTSIAGQKGVVF
jgi:hypothetical protein